MTDALLPAEDRLLETLAAATRGAARNGTYAVWLFVRVCAGVLPPEPVSEPGHRRRVAALARRLARLPLPAPLRRALVGAIKEIGPYEPRAAALALQQLVAPAKDILGADAGEAVALAARVAREVSRG